MGREEGRKREEGREQEEKKPLRTNSQRVERSKVEGEEKKRRSSREGEEERRSRRALFQSVSTSNLSSPHQVKFKSLLSNKYFTNIRNETCLMKNT